MKLTVIALVLLASCAGPAVFRCYDGGKAPYTSERYVPNGFANTESATVLTAHNPLSVPVAVHIRCNPTLPPQHLDRYARGWSTCLAPRTDKAVLVEFLPVDAMRQVCWVDRWAASPVACESQDEVY